jgi:hypothetical protein
MRKRPSLTVVYHQGKGITDLRPEMPDVGSYYDLVDELLEACSRHGVVPDENGVPDDVDYVPVDAYAPGNDGFVRLEVCHARALTRAWLADLMAVLRRFAPWGVILNNLGRGTVIVYGDSLHLEGEHYQGCRTLEDVVTRAAEDLALGDAGLKHLEKCQRLKDLSLFDTRTTRAGILALKKKLPKCYFGCVYDVNG